MIQMLLPGMENINLKRVYTQDEVMQVLLTAYLDFISLNRQYPKLLARSGIVGKQVEALALAVEALLSLRIEKE